MKYLADAIKHIATLGFVAFIVWLIFTTPVLLGAFAKILTLCVFGVIVLLLLVLL